MSNAALPSLSTIFLLRLTIPRVERDVAAVIMSIAIKHINNMGIQPMPYHLGPKGTSHTPPAQANRPTTRKNQIKLFQGPLVLKTTEKIQTIRSEKAKAINRSAIITKDSLVNCF